MGGDSAKIAIFQWEVLSFCAVYFFIYEVRFVGGDLAGEVCFWEVYVKSWGVFFCERWYT